MGGDKPSGDASSQPYDLLGGQYASFSGGTPSSGFNWGSVGPAVSQGFQNAGRSIAGSQTAYSPQSVGQFSVPGEYPPAAMPELIQDSQKNDIMMALQRLLSQGGGGYS